MKYFFSSGIQLSKEKQKQNKAKQQNAETSNSYR